MLRLNQLLSRLLRPSVALILLALTLSCATASIYFEARAQGASAAQAQGSIVPSLTGEVMRDGKSVLVDKAGVVPGEIIIWKMRVENRGAKAVRGVKAIGMIPPGTLFVPESAHAAGAVVQFSIDGGRNFSAQPTVLVDGQSRPAPIESYTHVLFIWESEVDAGQVKIAQYNTRVR